MGLASHAKEQGERPDGHSFLKKPRGVESERMPGLFGVDLSNTVEHRGRRPELRLPRSWRQAEPAATSFFCISCALQSWTIRGPLRCKRWQLLTTCGNRLIALNC